MPSYMIDDDPYERLYDSYDDAAYNVPADAPLASADVNSPHDSGPGGTWADPTPPPPVAQPSAPTLGGLVSYNGPSHPDYGFYRAAPGFHFNAPPPFSYADFTAPTLEQAQNEPGYAFARDEGQRAMQQSAAGRGLLRSGGTLKDLAAWANKFAEQNYGNVFNRAQQTWQGNRNSAFDNYNMNYNNAFNLARAQYEPELLSWQQEMNLDKESADDAFNRAYDTYKYDNPSGSEILNAGLN